MATLKSYDSSKVKVTVGYAIIEGFQGGSFVNIVEMGDGWTSSVGADGHKTRSKDQDQSLEITLTLQASSASNLALSTMADVDRINGDGLVPIWIQDLRGDTLASASEAWVRKKPDQEFNTEVGTREWVIETGNDVLNIVGGNN